MCRYKDSDGYWMTGLVEETEQENIEYYDLPAWSLHRLIELCPISIRHLGYHYSLIYDIHRDWVVYMLYANGNNKPYN